MCVGGYGSGCNGGRVSINEGTGEWMMRACRYQMMYWWRSRLMDMIEMRKLASDAERRGEESDEEKSGIEQIWWKGAKKGG